MRVSIKDVATPYNSWQPYQAYLLDGRYQMCIRDRNKEYGAYQLRKGTSGRNIKALLILVIAAALVGGFLAWKVIEQRCV